MNAGRFWRGVGVALLLSVLGAAAFWLFAPMLGGAVAIRSVLLLVAGACLIEHLLCSSARAGRLLAISAWLLSMTALLLLDPPLWCWWAAPAALLWLLRALAAQARPLLALLDAGLLLLAVGCAAAVLRSSGSVGLALWSFLLLQALAASLSAPRAVAVSPADRFTTAQRSAEAALRTLLDPRSVR
jgi:hypothetical protein